MRISTKKAGALLAVLALSPRQTATREQLATLLWGGFAEERARQSLRQALSSLRRDLQVGDILITDAETVRLAPESVWVDAMAFTELAASGDRNELREAVALLNGELLAGLQIGEETFETWVRHQRRLFETAGSAALEGYARLCDAEGDGSQAIGAVERLLAVDPLREDWLRLALRLYATHRGRNVALSQARRLTENVRRELDVEPDAETLALIGEIERGDIPTRPPPPPDPTRDNSRSSEAAEPVASASGIESAGAAPVAAGTSVGLDRAAGAPAVVAVAMSQLHSKEAAVAASKPWRPVWTYVTVLVAVVLLGALARTMLAQRGAVAPGGADNPQAAADLWRSPTSGLEMPVIAGRSSESVIPILVLPFTSAPAGATEVATLASHVSDDLINLLSRVYRFRVISRSTARALQGRNVDVGKIGGELGVRYVVEGALRQQGRHVRVNVELVDTRTRLTSWTDQFVHDTAKDDRQAVADEIVIRIARALQITAHTAEMRRRTWSGGESDLVDKGWSVLFKSGVAPIERVRQAETLFSHALQVNAKSLSAHLGIAAVHVEAVAELAPGDAARRVETAFEHLREAQALEPDAPELHYWLGRAHRHRGENAEALREFAKVLEANPSHLISHGQIGLTLLFSGKPADALPHIEYAMRLGPHDPNVVWLSRFAAEASLELGDLAAARRHIERSLELGPNLLRAWGVLAAVLALEKKADKLAHAVAMVRKLGPTYGDDELLERISRRSRVGPTRLFEGLRLALQAVPRSDQASVDRPDPGTIPADQIR